MRNWIASGRGAVGIEFALLLPLVLALVWVFWQMGETYRVQRQLHWTTAEIADMLMNQPEKMTLADQTLLTVALEEQLTQRTIDVRELLQESMFGDDPNAGTAGLVVEYLSGKTTEDGMPAVYTFQAGQACGTPAGTKPLLTLSGQGGGQLTPAEVKGQGMRLLRVRSCVRRRAAPAFLEWAAPKDFLSQFLAVRKID